MYFRKSLEPKIPGRAEELWFVQIIIVPRVYSSQISSQMINFGHGQFWDS